MPTRYPGTKPPHGNRGRYTNCGCRCTLCRRAQAHYMKHYLRRTRAAARQAARVDLYDPLPEPDPRPIDTTVTQLISPDGHKTIHTDPPDCSAGRPEAGGSRMGGPSDGYEEAMVRMVTDG